MTINLRDVGSGYKRTSINANFTDIENEINNNLLSKNGGVGLEADLDANSQKIINLADGVLGSDAVTLDQLNGTISAAGSGLIVSQTEVQTGADVAGLVTTFTGITYTVGGNNLYVFRNGNFQTKGIDYTETSSSSITWMSAPNSTDGLTFITNLATTNSVTTTAGITHSENGSTYTLSSYLPEKMGLYAGGTQASLITALASGAKKITLGATGSYALSTTINIPAGVELTSDGATVSVSGNTTIFSLAQGSKVTNINFTGTGIVSGNTSEIPVYISGAGLCEVSGCSFNQIGGTGIVIRQYYSDHDGSRVVDNDITYCNVGIDLQERGEYCTVGQNTINNNATGLIIQGGNNRAVNNTITDNTTGVHVKAGTNDAHGNVNSNSINHNITNILIDAINVEEMSFDGNSIYVGKITLNGCAGVTFTGGLIESSSLIEEKGATDCEFRNVKFPGGINNTPNDGTASKVLYKDCIIDRSFASTVGTSINGAYSEVRRNGSTTLATLSSTTNIFNDELFNAVTANTSFTVEQLYNTGTQTWEPTGAIVERGFTTQVNLQLSVSRTGADVDIDNVHCLVVDAANDNIIYGVAVSSPKNVLTGDVRTHTFTFAGEVPREDFQVKLINNSANTITILSDQADARSKVIVTGW